MYQSPDFYKPEDNPTLAELMWERDLDPFDDDDCITFGKSIAKFSYNIPREDFEDLLLEFVSEYLDERIGTGSLMQWMLHLRSYAMDRKGWYEDTYDLFKDIDKFAFLGRRVERDTNENREKEEKGTRGVTRSEDEDNESTLARDVSESGTTLNTRTQDDVLLGERNRQEDLSTVNTNNTNTTANSETSGSDSKTGNNLTTVSGSSSKTNNGTDTEKGTVTREDNKKGNTTTETDETNNDIIFDQVVTEGKNTDTSDGWNTDDNTKRAWGNTSGRDTTTTDNIETDDTIVTGRTNEWEDTDENTIVKTDNRQNTLNQNAAGIGTATGPIGTSPGGSGSFGSRVPSSGVVKDSTFEEGQTIDDNRTKDDKHIDGHRWGDTKNTTDGTKTLDGFSEVVKSGDHEDNEQVNNRHAYMDNKETKINNTDTKNGTVNTEKWEHSEADSWEYAHGSDTIDKTFTKDSTEIGNEDRTDENKIDETTTNTSTENRTETGSGESQENTAGNTLENVNDNRKVDEKANETRNNTTDIDEELFRKLRRMVEENENREDLSTETNAGTMVETTTGDVVPLMELARRYYDLRVSSKNRWVKEARKLFKYNYNF